MAIPNTIYCEALAMENFVVRGTFVDRRGLLHAPTEPGVVAPTVP
jgi:hypothetical protein